MKYAWSSRLLPRPRQAIAQVLAIEVVAFALGARAAPAAAQEGAVTGTVVEASTLRPVVGAQVFVWGTSLGALTDENGRYRIERVPVGRVEVRVQVIGYADTSRTVEVRGGETATADFQLEIAVLSLDELVVTAIGEQRRREVGNALGRVNAEQVEKRAPSTLEDLLQGQVTGVTVRKSSGSVGTGNDLKIRGVSTITLDNTPLVYVDGARVSNNNVERGAPGNFFTGGQAGSRLNDLNPEDIESIEIVKGPSAATLYGTEAAGGVILIRTKRGAGGSGATRWNLRAEVGGSRDVTDWPGVAYNPTDDLLLVLPFAKDTLYTMNLMEGSPPGIETPFRTGLQQAYGGNVSGGIGGVDFFASADYRQADGNLPANDLTQWSVRANFGARPSDRVSIDISNGFISNDVRLPDNDNTGTGYIGSALLGRGFFAPFDRPDPNDPGAPIRTCPVAFELARAEFGDLESLSEERCGNPFLLLPFDDITLYENTQGVERYTGSARIVYRPVPAWTNRLTVGYDQFTETTRELTPVVPRLQSVDRDFLGDLEIFVNRNRNVTLEATSGLQLRMTERLGTQTTLGVQYNSEQIQGLNATGEVFPAGSPSIGNAVTTTAADFTVETRTIGLFVQEQLSWNDRIFLTPALRFDDNSASGENLGIQTLPRVQASWLLSGEEWFPELFQQFRLRAAWGQSGIQPSSTAALAIFEAISTEVGGSELLGVTPSQPANARLSAARSEEVEGGFDASLLDGRLGVELTYYDQRTANDLILANLAPSLGFPDPQFVNIGEISSRGIEASLKGTVLNRRGVRWDMRAQVSTNDGHVERLTGTPIIFGILSGSQRHQEGFPFGAYVTEKIVMDPETGEARVLTCQEDPTNCVPDPSSATGFDGSSRFLGHPQPEWEGSVSTTLSLFDGRVRLYGLLDFMGGHQLLNGTQAFRCSFILGRCEEIFERDAEGELTDAARIKREAARVGSEGPWIEDADFARLRTVSLSFELPRSWTQPVGLHHASLTLRGENLSTWTGYSGLDPEISFAGGANDTRAEFMTLPPAQNFFARVSVGF